MRLIGRKPFSPASFRVSEPGLKPAMFLKMSPTARPITGLAPRDIDCAPVSKPSAFTIGPFITTNGSSAEVLPMLLMLNRGSASARTAAISMGM